MNPIDLGVLEKEYDVDLTKETTERANDWLKTLNLATVSADELQALVVQPREFLLEPLFKVGDFGILHSQRGVGKTWLAYSIARGVSQGSTVGLWTCPTARRVLVVDGEMPLDLSKERDKQFAKEGNNLFFLHHQVLFDRTGAELNLTSPVIQDALEELCVQREISLLILDNQSTLMAGVSETDPDSWNQIQPFLLRLQRRRIAVLLVVHAGRNNQARGHSRCEDRASWMISLTDRKEDDEQGAKLISEFNKPSRVCTIVDTPPLLWEFTQQAGKCTTCTCRILTKLDQFRQLLEQGMGEDPGEIAAELKVSPGYVSKLAQQGICGGWCRKEGRGYALVS